MQTCGQFLVPSVCLIFPFLYCRCAFAFARLGLICLLRQGREMETYCSPRASVCPSVRTHEWTVVGYFKFPNFLRFIHLRNKPHLHMKGAYKLKMRFIP